MITIWGQAWSGKSTVSKMLASRLGYERISIGDMKRKLAEKMGLSISEFNKLWDLPENVETFDLKYETYQQSLDPTAPIVLDSRLGFYNQPDAFKVFLQVDPEEGAKRIRGSERATDTYESLQALIEATQERNREDSQRYQELYQIDHLDTSNYDLLVDTTTIWPDQVVDRICERYQYWKKT